VDAVDPDGPDMFVFGFQELDLSTEALLYSTSNAREDAWCNAIFAALGEKGIKYEKVTSSYPWLSIVAEIIISLPPNCLLACFW